MDFLATIMILQLFLLQHKIRALKLNNISVPAVVYLNETVHLTCSYELESDILYSVTWYKDENEFFKYIPKGDLTVVTHQVNGVILKHHALDGRKITLDKVNLQSTGVYKCDVVADASNFRSLQAEAHMEVIAPPNSNPQITGEEKTYATGDVLTLNCTSDRSYPAARISWFVNGQKVNADSETLIQRRELISTASSLRLELGPDHLSAGQIVVRCEAVVSSNRVASTDALVDKRDTKVFVQGKSSTASPNTWLLAALILHRVVHLCR